MVPLARSLSAKITEVAVDKALLSGAKVPCNKRCSECCSYLAPLSVPQAYSLTEAIFVMPSAKRARVLKGCLSVAQRAQMYRQPMRSYVPSPDPSGNKAPASTASDWHWDLGLGCPFLPDDVCTIYEDRPLVCREYYATGCARACA